MEMTNRNLRRRRVKEVSDTNVIQTSRCKSVRRTRPIRKCVLKKMDTSGQKPKKTLARNDATKIIKGMAVRTNKLNESSIKEKSAINYSNMKQISLKESLNQAIAKRLRPRCNLKNYCEDSTKSTEQDVTVVKQLNIDNGVAVPIYKSVKNQDEFTTDKHDIYDFKFDVDDSKEKIKKKKRKHTGRKVVTKKGKKQNVNGKSSTNAQCMVHQANDIPTVKVVVNEPAKTDKEKSLVFDCIDKVAVENVVERIESSKNLLPEEVSLLEEYSENKPKSVAVSIKNSAGNKKADPRQKEDSNVKSFQASNVFKKESNIRHENAFDYSLLNKSLSPILKVAESFDPGSPWRTPPLFAFSHIKNLFQSTPQDIRTSVFSRKKPRYVNDYTKNLSSATIDLDSSKNNSKHVKIQKDMKDYLACSRKFGTEITNTDHLKQPIINVTNDEQNEISLMKDASNFTNVPIVNISEHSFEFDITENKENAVPNNQSPKKNLKKQKSKTFTRLKESFLQKDNLVNEEHIILEEMHSPQKTSENFEPRPGPSGMQKQKSFNISKPLQQANLNNFLNLPDIPQSTKISTAHGIFNDVHSLSVNANSTKTLLKEQHDIKNAFGLCDNESESNSAIDETILPILPTFNKIQKITNACKSKIESLKLPIRMPTVQIKTTSSVKSMNKKVQNEMGKLDKEENGFNEDAKNENKQLMEATNFSDTFDLLASEQNESDQSNVPLFVDLEPRHFIEPPKHSYKRKRDIRFNFTEDEDIEVDEDIEKINQKKKKYKKTDKKAEERIRKWIKSINETFNEIDHHTLLVE